MAHEDKKEENSERKEEKQEKSVEQEVRNISEDYKSKQALPSDVPDNVKKEMEKTREKLEKFKKEVLKKYPFTVAIGIIPPQASEKFEEEEEISEKAKKEKPIHILVIIPEEKFKGIQKIKADLVESVKNMNPKIWLHVMTPVDIFNYALDSKYDLMSAIAMSFPLYDKGLLGALRVAEIHKTLVLRKFEKYVASYVIGGSLVRGTSTKTSDVDVFIIINDTDVKRMSRLELKEKLRSIIYSYVLEASELAGVKNKLSPQVYILTDFWESVKDAHPVIFTFIRDGIPLYDIGTFLPWKLLLKMGKIKPSQESIDMFMSMGDKVSETVKRRLLDIVMGDIYWSVITPSQALLMLYGLPPPNTYETVEQMKKIFVDKEKMLEQKYVDILDNIAIKYYKGYEHEKVKEVSGKEVDKLLKDAEDYMKRLKDLREQIEKTSQQRTVEQIYRDVFHLLEGIFGKKPEKELVEEFDAKFVKRNKLPENYLEILKDIVRAREQFKKGKLAKHEVEDARKNASLLINFLIDYNQRTDLINMNRGKIRLLTKEKGYDLVFAAGKAFLIDAGNIFKITDKVEKSTSEELNKALSEQQKDTEVKTDSRVLEIVKKYVGDFEIIL